MNAVIINPLPGNCQINIVKECFCCGSTFSTPKKDAWKKLCGTCFVWVKAGRNISLTVNLFKKL